MTSAYGKKPRLVFVASTASSFVRKDARFLEEHFALDTFTQQNETGFRYVLFLLRLLGFLLVHLPRSRGVFIWFADHHSYLAILLAWLFRKPSYLVLGGFETASFPEYQYGGLRSPLRRRSILGAIRLADWVLPVDHSLIDRIPEGLKGGVRGRILELPTGYDAQVWQADMGKARDLILTVAFFDGPDRAMIKGLDRFVALATALPEYPFCILGAGPNGKEALGALPANLEVLPGQPYQSLPEWYGRAAIFCQLSRSEGLPNTLCEAMLCGCIPVGTRVGGIPKAIGDCGIVMEETDLEDLAGQIRAMYPRIAEADRVRARRHIMLNFDQQKRHEKLLEILPYRS